METLRLLSTSPSIKQFLVTDFFARAKRTLKAMSENDYKCMAEADRFCVVTNWRPKVKVETILDPMNLILLSR